MAERSVRIVGDPVLRERAREVQDAGKEAVRTACRDLVDTLGAFRARHGFGRGIAAPQIGVPLRIVALDLGEGPIVLINPEITWRSDATFTMWDDCMSFPDRLVRLRRHERVSVRFLREDGSAECWEHLPCDRSELLQHELDHLDGILALDRAGRPEDIVYRADFEADPERYRARVDAVTAPSPVRP